MREAPPGLPFAWDAKTIRNGLNFTLTTEVGDIDLLGDVADGETYQTLSLDSFEVEALGVRFKCLDLPTLIRIKEAAGRPKDREAVAELRVLLEESEKKRT
jgi:predicted nucleotidyltransferase